MAARKPKKQPEPEQVEETTAAASESGGQQEEPDIMQAMKDGFAEMRGYIDDRVGEIENTVGGVVEEQADVARYVPRITEGRNKPQRPHRDVNAQGAGAYIENYQHGSSGGRQIPVGADGRRIPDYVFDSLKPRFLPGDRVLIDRETQKDGAWAFARHEEYIQMTGELRVNYEILKDEEGNQIPIMWGEVLDAIDHDGVIEIVKSAYFSDKARMWKYRCYAPGIGDGENSGEGFWDYELKGLESEYTES